MSSTYNIYCDESCHLEHDGFPVMVLGGIWCDQTKTKEIAKRLREIKIAHGLSPTFETKWTKVSPAKLQFYRGVIDYFFDDDDLHLRALVAPKGDLRHEDFGQDHDQWYYKMFFELLKLILIPKHKYRIYLDVKDTRSAARMRKLHEVLANNLYDFDRSMVERVQSVRSHEVEILQLADLLIGAIGYANRPDGKSQAKRALVARIQERSGYGLLRSTLWGERKFNLFHWKPQGRG